MPHEGDMRAVPSFEDQGRSLRLLAAAIVVINGFFPALWILPCCAQVWDAVM